MSLKKILIFKIGHLGDTLVGLPAFRTIRQNYPEAHLTLLANLHRESPKHLTALDVLPEVGFFNETITYPQQTLRLTNINQYFKLMLNIKQGNYDCLVYLMTRNRTIAQINRDRLFFSLCGIKKIIGIDYLKENLLDYKSPRPLQPVESEIDFLISSVRESDLFQKNTDRPTSDLILSETENNFAARWIIENCPIEPKNKLVAVAPGSKWPSKVWDNERYAEVVRRLINKFQIYPIVFGGPEDRELGRRLVAGWQKGVNSAGFLTVRESAAVLRKCQIYLGNDTGTMHLAASVGVRCVAVFSAVDYPDRWNPVGDGHRLFRESVSCEGCHSEICFNNSLCMTLTSVETVYEACAEILNNS